MTPNITKTGIQPRKLPFRAAAALLLAACGVSSAQAQQGWSPVVITPPIIDKIDENYVSVLSDKATFTIGAVELGDVSFTPVSVNGYFARPTPGGYYGLMDNNYGTIVACMPIYPATQSSSQSSQTFIATGQCAVPTTTGGGLQATYGQERATFTLANGQYSPYPQDSSTFVDNGSTCTWTTRDGTQFVFAAYHVSGDARCFSNNIAQIIRPNGRIATYYYYGASSTTLMSPILSIATNSGYLLKYNYSGTPAWGAETSVVAVNRAFETCDPSAIACTPIATWPTATVSWQDKIVSVSDNFIPTAPNYNPYLHSILTIVDSAHTQHVFELDSYDRVISYQPPEASSPVYFYNLCSVLSNNTTLINCGSYKTWPHSTYPYDFEPQPLLFDRVGSSTRNGQTWSHGYSMSPSGSYATYSAWSHFVTNPLGRVMSAQGNATPGMESQFGPTDSISHYDGTTEHFARNTRNLVSTQQTAAGIVSSYGYDVYRGNLLQLNRTPVPGSPEHTLSQSAVYPPTCTNIVTCNKPTYIRDAKQNETDFTYDPTHGGVLTVTGPAVNGVQPQTRRTYVPRYAWYLASSGAMTRETHLIWLLQTESICRTGSAATSGPGCANPNDEVLTTYDYGPDSGPNNLLLRGITVTADGQTHRTCYGHDPRGNKIWETSPGANPSSCPSY